MNPLKRFAHKTGEKFTKSFACEKCAHSVLSHKRALPQYEHYSNRELGMMIRPDINLRKRTLPFCDILICDACESGLEGCPI